MEFAWNRQFAHQLCAVVRDETGCPERERDVRVVARPEKARGDRPEPIEVEELEDSEGVPAADRREDARDRGVAERGVEVRRACPWVFPKKAVSLSRGREDDRLETEDLVEAREREREDVRGLARAAARGGDDGDPVTRPHRRRCQEPHRIRAAGPGSRSGSRTSGSSGRCPMRRGPPRRVRRTRSPPSRLPRSQRP